MINEIKGSLPLSLPGIVGTENLRGLPALYPRDCTPRMEDGGLYPRFILDRQLFPRNAVNSWRGSARERGCTRTQGWTTDRSASPVRRRVNYRPSNRIDVKDLRCVVLPPYSVSAVSRFLSSSPARERKRERELVGPLVPNFRNTRPVRAIRTKNFLKNRLAAYIRPILDDDMVGPPSFHPIPTRSIRILPSSSSSFLRPI